MIKLIIGTKGSGKTKTLIDMVNHSLESTEGKVVCIEKGTKLIHDIKYQARLIDTQEYFVDDAQSLFGFVAGIAASDHDITDLYIDSALKICQNDLAAFDKFIGELDELSAKLSFNCVMTASMPVEDATEVIKAHL